MSRFNKNTHQILYRKYGTIVKYFLMVFSIVIITIVLPKQPRFKYEFEKGMVWLHDDLVAPYNFSIRKTAAEIKQDRESIAKSILPVYRIDDKIFESQVSQYQADFEAKWLGAKLPEGDIKEKTFEFGFSVLKSLYDKGIIGLNQSYQKNQSDGSYLITLLKNNVRSEVSTATLLTPSSALSQASERIVSNKSVRTDILISVIKDRITPNVILDERFSEALEKQAVENVSVTRGMVQKGEVIVENGNVVNENVYQKLESLRQSYEENAKMRGDRKQVFLGQFLAVGLVITLLMVFLYLFRKDIFADNRKIALILLIIIAMLVFLSWAVKIKLPSVYYIPYAIVPIIIRILFDTRLALNIHLLVVLVAGFFVPNSFEFAFLQITAGMVAIYSIKNLVRREQFLISAMLILLNYFVSYLGISLIREGALSSVEWMKFLPFVFSVLLSLLAYPLIYLFERMFGITSDITLMELTNTNSNLLRELAFKAPGTFQHSLQVANLAEAAIYKIGGNALLVRAGALYHDIGKIENPQFFVENQIKGINPHDKLSYEDSAQIIIKHVENGIELARRNNLPEVIIDFIRTHHGNTRVDYFYQSFLKNFPEKFIDENIFRYPGPIPFSKETAVLMLADSVEAASRALKEPDAESINNLVERVIDYKLEQNQLNDSNITLKEIETIKLIFKTMLMGIYHVRIDYPE
ncbi:7TM receptor with intracellular metal dependent phosphohydrolase [Pseudopedobacter saltans DSM 12145]|uniref:7TM receptor with intracellular metal dependent phosphohydrolase n=2 Tax=Pseudopedobacter saltans TaxID=151895 RepID=F0SBT4_PSESL|nr:7TM receptor with intracellular metal dependent phosphohydrolase [Pseudopedobacter saltans DSM 12145]